MHPIVFQRLGLPSLSRRWWWAVGAVAAVAGGVYLTRRGRLLSGVTVSDSDLDELREKVDEHPDLYKKAVQKIQATAEQLAQRGESVGDDKVFISDIAKAMRTTPARIANLLIVGSNKRWIRLARADLVGAMNPEQVSESLLRYHNASFHFVLASEPVPAEVRQARYARETAERAARTTRAAAAVTPRSKNAAIARGELTSAKLYAALKHAVAPEDRYVVEAAMSPHETADQYGDPLVDYHGKEITRTAARREVKRQLTDDPPTSIDWYNAAVKQGAGREEWLEIAEAIDKETPERDVADLAARARDARSRAGRLDRVRRR